MSEESGQSGEIERLRVAVLCGRCQTPGAPPYPVYGLQVESGDRRWRWQDLDGERNRVEALAQRLKTLCPEPCHIEDIVRDFVLERYLP